jgi:electron transfer flavoprotein alpha subunit
VDPSMSAQAVLVLAHVESDGALARPALESLTAGSDLARALGSSLTVGLVGADVRSAASTIGGCGASHVYGVSGEAFGVPRYVTDAAAAEAICRAASPDIIVVAGTSRWMRVAAGVAQRLQGRVDSHVTRMAADSGPVSVSRWYYRQRIEGVTSRSERPWIIAVEPGTHDAWTGPASAATVEPVTVALSAVRTNVVGVRSPSTGEQTIRPDAPLLLVAGAGWTKKQPDGQTHVPEAEALILGFLRSALASLGGSKSLVDLSGEGQAVLPFMTHLNQIGQTGSSPRHRKGLATCCHGEEPHVVGWRFITERRAINLNPNCGWAQGKTDVLYVADAFEVMRKVNERLG